MILQTGCNFLPHLQSAFLRFFKTLNQTTVTKDFRGLNDCARVRDIVDIFQTEFNWKAEIQMLPVEQLWLNVSPLWRSLMLISSKYFGDIQTRKWSLVLHANVLQYKADVAYFLVSPRLFWSLFSCQDTSGSEGYFLSKPTGVSRQTNLWQSTGTFCKFNLLSLICTTDNWNKKIFLKLTKTNWTGYDYNQAGSLKSCNKDWIVYYSIR